MPNHKKSVDVSFTVPGTPEQIWDAIATGPGISAWFTPTSLDLREGGAITFHLGPDMDSKGTITVWDPPHLFAYEERDWSGDAPPLATEFRIETEPGGEPCKVRIVHSLFTDRDDWDDQLASMEGGWGAMFGVLDLYLRDFAGAPGVCIRPTVPFAGDLEAGWRKLEAAVERDYASSVVRKSSGSKNREALLRLVRNEGTVALISAYDWGGKISLVACVYFYGEGGAAAAERAEPHWQAWLQAAAAAASS